MADPLCDALMKAPSRRNPIHDLWDELACKDDYTEMTLPEQKALREKIDRITSDGSAMGSQIESVIGKLKTTRGTPAPTVPPGF